MVGYFNQIQALPWCAQLDPLAQKEWMTALYFLLLRAAFKGTTWSDDQIL